MPYYTAIVSLLAVALYFFPATQVAVARGKYNVKLPATTGSPDFERVFPAHENTLEWMPTCLVPLWICAVYLNDVAAAVLGMIWIGVPSGIFQATANQLRSAFQGSSSRGPRASCCSSAPSSVTTGGNRTPGVVGRSQGPRAQERKPRTGNGGVTIWIPIRS